jgi:hypothetical protein
MQSFLESGQQLPSQRLVAMATTDAMTDSRREKASATPEEGLVPRIPVEDFPGTLDVVILDMVTLDVATVDPDSVVLAILAIVVSGAIVLLLVTMVEFVAAAAVVFCACEKFTRTNNTTEQRISTFIVPALIETSSSQPDER